MIAKLEESEKKMNVSRKKKQKKKTDFFNSDDLFFKMQVLIQTFHRSAHILMTVG